MRRLNTFLDALAHYRQAHGLPALSIDWGAWSTVGLTARLAEREQQRLAAQGHGVIAPEEGIQVFQHLLHQASAQTVVMPVDWRCFLDLVASTTPFFAEVDEGQKTATGLNHAAPVIPPPVTIRQQLAQRSAEERPALLIQQLQSAVAKVLGLERPEKVDPRRGFMELGVDSLMSIELRNNLVKSLEQQLPSTLLFDYPTINALSNYLLNTLWPAAARQPNEPQRAPLAVQQPVKQQSSGQVDRLPINLSETELATSISDELAKLARVLKVS